MKVLPLSNIVGAELFVSSRDNINDAHIKVSSRFDLSEFFRQEVFKWRTIIETALKEQTSGNASEPALIKLSIGGISPELFHSRGGSFLFTLSVIGKDDSVDGTSRDSRYGVVSVFIGSQIRIGDA